MADGRAFPPQARAALQNQTLQDVAALAQDARDQGMAALASGETDRAVRWLDRALRLVPRDPNIALSLASVVLGRDPARAATLFRQVAIDGGPREAWQGLAAAHLLSGQPEPAAQAIARALSSAVITPEAEALANAIAERTDHAGWCGISERDDGATLDLIIHPRRPAEIQLRLDGQQLHGTNLPPGWAAAHTLDVMARDGRHFLGSPLRPNSLRHLTGFVEAVDGGLVGWAWYPGNPSAQPRLLIQPSSGDHCLSITASDTGVVVEDAGPLARPRGFRVPAARLSAHAGPWHVRSPEGQDLLGSPLHPRAMPPQAARRPRARSGPPHPLDTVGRQQVDVVMPAHGNAAVVLACLDSVLPSLPSDTNLIVVDDASDDPSLRRALDGLAAAGRITLIRHTRNLGFPASANAGIAAARGDVVLLNSDTLVPRGWLARLRDVVYAAPGIGTATPLSNEATIVSYPLRGGGNPAPDQRGTDRMAALAWRTLGAQAIEIPVGVGFCLYIRRACLDAVGTLRSDIFAQGYGEENDFCLRARALGWRHVAAPGVFVTHLGGASFGGAGRHLLRRNQRLLNQLHPGYDAQIAAFARDDPLAGARRQLDLARWRAMRPKPRHERPETILLITHADGGGVEQRVQAACQAHCAAGRRPIVLRPVRLGLDVSATLESPAQAATFPNLSFQLPDEVPTLLRLLRAERITSIELHHFLDHHPMVLDLPALLGVPHEVHIHDYAWFCPRVALVDADHRYCREPPPAECEICVARGGRFIPDEISIPALIDRSARFLQAARQVHAPSHDAARRMRRHFPGLRPIVTPHTRLKYPAALRGAQPPTRSRICIAGAIGLHKGYEVLLACAQDAARRDLDVEFVVAGTTTDDARLMATGRVFITGRYQPHEAVALIQAQSAQLGFLPSIWPETWCLALTELWQAGLDVVAFDIGAQAERISKSGRGVTVPLGLPVEEINNVLVAAVCRDRDTNVR